MNFGATPGGVQVGPPVCQNCSTSTTPLWRRDEAGTVLCNACGLFLKLHGRPRPISLKTDVIKSRNRVKTSGKKGENGVSHAASHPYVSASTGLGATHAPGKPPRIEQPTTASDTTTDSLLNGSTSSNIAPQHVFDGVALANAAFSAQAFAANPYPRSSSPDSEASDADAEIDLPTLKTKYQQRKDKYNQKRTRAKELELVNGLYLGRVSDLESNETRLRNELSDALARESGLKQHLEEVMAELNELREIEPDRKRLRFSDMLEHSRGSTPNSSVDKSGL